MPEPFVDFHWEWKPVPLPTNLPERIREQYEGWTRLADRDEYEEILDRAAQAAYEVVANEVLQKMAVARRRDMFRKRG